MADEKTTKHQVRNIAKGPRGLHGIDGFVELDAGKSGSVEMTDAEFASAKATGYFHFDSEAKADAKLDEAAFSGEGLPSNPMQLKKLAKDEGIDVGGATTAADLQRLILAAREVRASQSQSGGGDNLDDLSDEDLANTVAAITGQTAPEGADRATLLALARGGA